jgi:hypothetical protein
MVREGRLTDEEIREDAEITEFWRKITEVAFAEEASAFPEKASARTEQHAVYDKRIQDGWKQNPEFGNALVLALVVGEVNPLADYIASTKPLTEDDRGDLACLVLSWQKPRQGRPPKRSVWSSVAKKNGAANMAANVCRHTSRRVLSVRRSTPPTNFSARARTSTRCGGPLQRTLARPRPTDKRRKVSILIAAY